jgi:diacylglycerol kinase family enzyme
MGEVKVGKGKKFPFFELVMVGIGSSVYPDALHASKGKKPIASIKNAIAKVVKHHAAPKVTVKMDQESNVTVETMLAIVANVPLIGPNMLLDPDASSDDGLLDVSLYPNFSKAELLAYMAKALATDDVTNGKIQRYRARKIKIKSHPKQEVMADGVMLGKGKVKIRVKPGSLRVIAPEVGTGVEKPAHETGAAELPAPVAPVPDNNNKNEQKVETVK